MPKPSDADIRSASKFLSLLLRHQPDLIGLQIDDHGWANVEELIAKARAESKRGRQLDRTLVELVVAQNNKNRFSLSGDGEWIRANQGHSIDVDLELEAVEPPSELFHGTASRFLDSIMTVGLESRSRQHVHLSADRETAVNVGNRHGTPVVLVVDASGMAAAGYEFYLSVNGVWLTDHVPIQWLAR